jgi:DNA-binding MarR family transcriptional regulator
MNKQYDVAAYIWPSYTGNEPRTRVFWPEGIGEWQSVKNAVKKFPEHNWPRKPVWGYTNEADPYVMEMQINAAADHGVNVFIYDWYWFDKRPFLENCLNDGYLRAKNNDRVKFYLMWANHNVNYTWDIRNSHLEDNVIWGGAVDRSEFEKIGVRLIEKYFKLFFRANLKEHDLNAAEGIVLLLMYEKEMEPNSNTIENIHKSIRGKTLDQMIDEIHFDKAFMTRTMQSLESKGFVVRNPNPTDNRSFVFTLTGKAAAFRPTLLNILKLWNDSLMKNVESQNIEIIRKALSQMASNVISFNDGENI